VVLRTFLQILNASIGKRTLLSVAIISLAVIVLLVAVSFRNELTEDELIGAIPTLALAGFTELQPAGPLAASTASPLAGDAETTMGSSGASRELVPSPRPRPMHKPHPRQAQKIRNIPDNVLPILLAGSIEVQPMRPLAALMAAPRAGDAETLVQDSVTSGEPGRLLPPVSPTEVQPAGDAETAMGSSGASRELVRSSPSSRVHKSRPRRAHNMRNRSHSGVPTLSLAGPTELQPMRPLAAPTAAPPAGDAETAMGSSGAPRELVPSPRLRPVHKPRPSRAHNMRDRSNFGVPTLPPAGHTELQPMRPLAASTPPAGDAETAMGSSGASRELVPSPRPRPVHKPRARQAHNMRNVPIDVALRDAVAILKGLRDPSQIDRVVKDNPSNIFLLLMAEIRKASQETSRLVQKLIDEIEPPTLPKELNYARASRAQLEAYRLDLEAAEANAMAAMPRYVAFLESEREKVEVVVRSLDIDDRYIRAALTGIDKRTEITSKMLSANAEFYRATGGYVAFLIEQIDHYKISTNDHFMFSTQSIADRYEAASRQINDAIKRIAELEEERRKLAQFQQKEWERFASGN
jgi:hypothetical protein